MAGKGDTPRKVNGEKYRANYDAIFRKSEQGITWEEASELLEKDPASLVTILEPTFDASKYLPSPL